MKKSIFSMLLVTVLALTPVLTSFGAAPSGGSWVNDSQGWTFINRDGTTPTNTWEVIDGKFYYFDESGHILTDTTTPDGSTVDKTGAKTKEGRHIAYDGGEKDLFPFYPTTIKAEAPTLADTGLGSQVGEYEKDMINTLGKIQPCIGIYGDKRLYSFEKYPSVVFQIDSATNKDRYCLGAYGPFAAFFTCSGTDTITCAQLEEVLGVEITINISYIGDRHFATFTYNGRDYFISSCTHEGVFQGDAQTSAVKHLEWEPEKGFFDENGQWISI